MITKNLRMELNSTITFESQESMERFMALSNDQFSTFVGKEDRQPDGTTISLKTYNFSLSEV